MHFKFIPSRYFMAMLGSMGMAIIYGLRVNLSVGIVSMVNHTGVALEGEKDNIKPICPPRNTTSKIEDGPFIWNDQMEGLALSAYFWGYVLFQIPGGIIAEVYSAKYVMLAAVSLNILCTFLIPVMVSLHFIAFLSIRILQGLASGVTFPTMHVLIAHWALPHERGTLSSIVYSGSALGTVIYSLLCGPIAHRLGWELIFYIEGGISLIWVVLWELVVSDEPLENKHITKAESTLILTHLDDHLHDRKEEHPKVPWKQIFRCKPFWAIFISNICSNWGWFMVLTTVPKYFKKVLAIPIVDNAVVSSVPYLCMWVFSILVSKVLDVLLKHKKIRIATARKAATVIATGTPTLCLIGLCYVGCNETIAIALMTIAIMGMGAMFSGFLVNHIDIAPNFAGTLKGLTNTVGSIGGIIAPIVVGQLTEADRTIRAWRIIFWITCAFYCIEMVVFTIFASGEIQPWNYPPEQQEERRSRMRLNM